MAYPHSSSELPAPAHPQASQGYGKRQAPGQLPSTPSDFAHLPGREAELAGLIDRLPEGSAIGYKALAAAHPLYGQQACRSGVGQLAEAGHIRQIREHLTASNGCMLWVTRTYWSRTARSDEWWAEFVHSVHGRDVTVLRRSGKATVPAGEQEPATPPHPTIPGNPAQAPAPSQPVMKALPSALGTPQAEDPAAPSPAYRALAHLGRREPRMTLSAAECAALEPLAAEWLARGASLDHLTRALTGGLPVPVQNPGAIARYRLENKMPPKPLPEPDRTAQSAADDDMFRNARVTRTVMACLTCDADETTTRIVRGICADCRTEMDAYRAEEARRAIPATFLPGPRTEPPVDVETRANEARIAAGLPPKRGV